MKYYSTNSTFITTHPQYITVQCNCGCSIMQLFHIEGDRYYIQFYGKTKSKCPDIELNKEELIYLRNCIEEAINRKFNTPISEIEEIKIGSVINKEDSDALLICVDSFGYVSFIKYHDNFKKFYRAYKTDKDKITSNHIKGDWEIILAKPQAIQLATTLNNYLKMGEK